jgi:hypothetical protein
MDRRAFLKLVWLIPAAIKLMFSPRLGPTTIVTVQGEKAYFVNKNRYIEYYTSGGRLRVEMPSTAARITNLTAPPRE